MRQRLAPAICLLLSLTQGTSPAAPGTPKPKAPAQGQIKPPGPSEKDHPTLRALASALRKGNYSEALTLHKGAAKLPDPQRASADSLCAEALSAQGKNQEAEALLLATVGRAPKNLEARLTLGRLYRKIGNREKERAIWNQFFDDHDAGTLDMNDPAVLRQLGVAARYLGSYQDANEQLRDAVARARELKNEAEITNANLEWAALFLEKYSAGEAEVSLKEALAQDADNPDAHALYAKVKLEQGNDVAGAEKEIAAALAQNPRHPLALSTRAIISIDNEEYEAALAITDTLLGQDPTDLVGRSLRAAALLLLERVNDYKAEKAKVLAIHPRYVEMHRVIAELLVTQHRYEDAVALLSEAEAIDPKDAYTLSALGSGYLRLGEDEKGLAALRRAWKGDKFHVRTFNLLELFDNVIPKKYEVVTLDIDPVSGKGKGGLRLRIPRAEKELLLPLLVPLIQAEWKDLSKRYGFAPKLPLTLELYADPQHYAVRTVGLPGLQALGVTFGQVVTGRSPALGAFNWGLMIWHELSHVFAIQISRSRVPRWFTEGLSEWETQNVRKEWSRHTHAELYAALRDGKLPTLSELNAGFSRARDVAHMVVAYHEAAAAMDFLVRRFGFAAIVRCLRLFGEGKRANEVLPKVTGLGMDALDQAFRADLAAKLAVYKGTFYVRPTDYSDMEALEAEAKERPTDPRPQALMGLAFLHGGDPAKAEEKFTKALSLFPKCKEALLGRADMALRKKDLAAADATLKNLLAAQGDGYDLRFRMGLLAKQRYLASKSEAHLKEAVASFEAAKRLDPDRSEPYGELSQLYTKAQKEPEALQELIAATKIEIMDADLVRSLLKRLHAASRHADIVKQGDLVRYLDPYNADLRAQLGEAHLNLGQKSLAATELKAAILALPTASDPEEAVQLKEKRKRLEGLLSRTR